MALSISAVVLFGILTVFLLRNRAVSLGAATAIFLFGFFVASTGAQKTIYNLCQAIASTLTHLTA
ncbi:hypothetical protein [Streptomyces noursei]|uniref:DUF2304 domain-containing protein n=1 Tax=Streptomyces noursei TaxID=1971 RepID=A0A2N8PKQ2_STRNR|nr:hypothetical protein [Streptomyces noursei]PNE41606.1 hypothetical protein AOB60_13340 [Streptomyces noursei]